MLDTINGVPAHVLLIHVIVVLGPLGALFTALSALWPAARAKLGVISPLTCLIVLIFVPITASAGDWLKHKIDPNGQNPKIERHEQLGEAFLWFALGLFVVSAAVWWLGRRYEFGAVSRKPGANGAEPGGGGVAVATRTQPRTQQTVLPTWAAALLMIVSVAMSIATVWQLYRIGDAGAHAVWDGVGGS